MLAALTAALLLTQTPTVSTIKSNETVTANGQFAIPAPITGQGELSWTVGTISSGGSITFNWYNIDPQSGLQVGPTYTSGAVSASSTNGVVLGPITTGSAMATWTVAGSSPSIANTYLTFTYGDGVTNAYITPAYVDAGFVESNTGFFAASGCYTTPAGCQVCDDGTNLHLKPLAGGVTIAERGLWTDGGLGAVAYCSATGTGCLTPGTASSGTSLQAPADECIYLDPDGGAVGAGPNAASFCGQSSYIATPLTVDGGVTAASFAGAMNVIGCVTLPTGCTLCGDGAGGAIFASPDGGAVTMPAYQLEPDGSFRWDTASGAGTAEFVCPTSGQVYFCGQALTGVHFNAVYIGAAYFNDWNNNGGQARIRNIYGSSTSDVEIDNLGENVDLIRGYYGDGTSLIYRVTDAGVAMPSGELIGTAATLSLSGGATPTIGTDGGDLTLSPASGNVDAPEITTTTGYYSTGGAALLPNGAKLGTGTDNWLWAEGQAGVNWPILLAQTTGGVNPDAGINLETLGYSGVDFTPLGSGASPDFIGSTTLGSAGDSYLALGQSHATVTLYNFTLGTSNGSTILQAANATGGIYGKIDGGVEWTVTTSANTVVPLIKATGGVQVGTATGDNPITHVHFLAGYMAAQAVAAGTVFSAGFTSSVTACGSSCSANCICTSANCCGGVAGVTTANLASSVANAVAGITTGDTCTLGAVSIRAGNLMLKADPEFQGIEIEAINPTAASINTVAGTWTVECHTH